MTINGANPLDLSGIDAEVITIAVASSKAKVDVLLNGQVFTGTQFTLDKTKGDPFQLAVGGVYTDKTNGGGAFSVSLTGNGVTATQPATQASPLEARRSFVFTIDIV